MKPSGMSMSQCASLPPASSTSTDAPLALSRFASTQPAEPAPTTM